jgi:DNA-binding ferritin-like protein (Dps family)
MAKEDKAKNISKVQKSVLKINKNFNSFIKDMRFNITGSDTSRDDEIKKLNLEIDKVINSEISSMKNFTGEDVSTFLYKLLNDYDKDKQRNVKTIEDIFTNSADSNAILNFFYDRYRSRNLLFEDLNVITEQLFQLNEAVYTTRDAIVTSDDVSSLMSRQLVFKDLDKDETKNYISIVEEMEKRFDLQLRIKDHIVPKTLTYGEYYVYAIPYETLFKKYDMIKKKDIAKGALDTTTSTTESFCTRPEPVEESFVKKLKSDFSITDADKKISDKLNSYLADIEVYNTPLGIPILEGTDMSQLLSTPDLELQLQQATQTMTGKMKPKATTADSIYGPDGTYDPKKGPKFNVDGVYIKLIDPRKIIPVKVLDCVMGYYYIHEAPSQIKTTFTTNITIGPSTSKTFQAGPEQLENQFLSGITEKIVKAFDKKFLENNTAFKELILNALRYNEMYKKQIKFEFIPVEYMSVFKVNPDTEGNGTSILYRSVFYAKLYLAILIFKMITILTRSTDTRVHYIKQSGLDQDIANSLQNAARTIKERQINFMDLMSYQSIVSKVGHMKDLFFPVGRSGEKGIDFDILAGQEVQLNTELMEMLERGMISATGVPSVIMNYINEADYAKTLVMANAKFVGRVVNDQVNFNRDLTYFYQKLMKFTTAIPQEVINKFEYKFATPKTLNAGNMTDVINNTDQTVTYMVETLTGKNADPGEDGNLIKDMLLKKYAKEALPMLPWDRIEELLKEVKVELEQVKMEREMGTDISEGGQ